MALALLLLGLWPHDLHAQAFIASRPHPEFGIGPLFVSVSVGTHRGRSLGWVATVRQWDVEDHEVEIAFEHGRVRDVQTRVRRVPHSPLLRRS